MAQDFAVEPAGRLGITGRFRFSGLFQCLVYGRGADSAAGRFYDAFNEALYLAFRLRADEPVNRLTVREGEHRRD